MIAGSMYRIAEALKTIAECQLKHIEMMEGYRKELKLANNLLESKPTKSKKHKTINEVMKKTSI